MEHQREGQKAFNELYRTNPEIADKIRGTKFDPFYIDQRLPEFYKEVERLKKLN